MAQNQPFNFTLEELGLTPEILQERVVEMVTASLTTSIECDEDGNEIESRSPFIRAMQSQVKALVDAKVQAIAERDLLPRIDSFIENIVLQQTNQWGEKNGKSVTFIEYLVQRADAYLKEPTDWHGRAKGEPGTDYNWSAKTTRLVALIERNLAHSIQAALETALKNINASVAGGLEQAIKIQLDQVVKNIKVVAVAGR